MENCASRIRSVNMIWFIFVNCNWVVTRWQ